MAAFVETMRGTLTEPSGANHPVVFEVHAVGTGGGHHTLSGVVSAPPWTAAASADGTLIITLRPRGIAYSLWFRADDGRRLHLHARKTPSLRAPVHSMTWMPTQISDEAGNELASGSMRFELRDLPSFLASWLPLRSQALRRLEARQRQIERLAFAHGAPLP